MKEIKTRANAKDPLTKINPKTAAINHAKKSYIKTRESISRAAEPMSSEASDGPESAAISEISEETKSTAMKAARKGEAAGRRAFAEEKTKAKTRLREKNTFTSHGAMKEAQPQKSGRAKTKENVLKADILLEKKENMHVKKNYARKARHSFKKAARRTKSIFTAALAGGWIVVLIIVVCCLFGAAFYFFGDESGSDYTAVSPEVEAYHETISRYAKEEGIGEYVELIKAVMMQESAGKGTDPMQSSECGYNEKYDRKPGGIKDPEYSIECGVKQLAEAITKAEVATPVDIAHIRLALQGYNYGLAYISWEQKETDGYTVAGTAEYSDKMAEKLGTKSYGDKQYAAHVLRYYPYGNYNFGVGNTLITQIATKQIGNKGGKKFWSWYGFDSHVEWCACFVSWCADQCGYIKSGTIPKFALVDDGVSWFKERGQWQKRGYSPKPGDIIFFDWDGDGSPDHVGIVTECVDGFVNTVEGNSKDECKRQRYAEGSSMIYGYGVPKY